MTRGLDRGFDGDLLRDAQELRRAERFLVEILVAARRPRPWRAAPRTAPFDRIMPWGASAREVDFGEVMEDRWEAVALPESATPSTSLRSGDVVVRRAAGRMAFARVLGEATEAAALYRADGRIREDTLVLRRRAA